MDGRLANLDLNLLVPLQALLQERHITRAAALIGITQPAMSNALRRARAALGDELLVRSKSGYALTPRAEMVRETLNEVLHTIDDRIFQSPQFDPESSVRRFVVGASGATVYAALRPIVAQATARNRRVSFSFVDVTRAVASLLDRPDVDLILLPEVIPTEHARERLYDETWSLVVCAENRQVGDRVSEHQLATLPRVVFESDGLRTHAELALASLGGLAPSTVVSGDFWSLFHLIAGTPLIGCVQTTIARNLAANNGLRIVEPPTPLPGFGIDIVRNPLRRTDPAVDWLIGELKRATRD
ncbi:LysR family transcriptional regulator [Williamsia soli]|uniref:LysR family transcriptional regulator n=1 Tax=Williamsia soli TaxID=364929 RepID=UPI001A9FC5FE|nr:LysR family transcriptional regulator [Williamsia soli]